MANGITLIMYQLCYKSVYIGLTVTFSHTLSIYTLYSHTTNTWMWNTLKVDHRQLLQTVFSEKKKNVSQTWLHGTLSTSYSKVWPLTECWTVRFEAKHSLFKKVVRVPTTLKTFFLPLPQDTSSCWHITSNFQAFSSLTQRLQKCLICTLKF